MKRKMNILDHGACLILGGVAIGGAIWLIKLWVDATRSNALITFSPFLLVGAYMTGRGIKYMIETVGIRSDAP